MHAKSVKLHRFKNQFIYSAYLRSKLQTMWSKRFLWITLFCLGQISLQAQETEVFEMEYNAGKQFKKGAAFSILTCSESVLEDVWKDWIKSKNGKVSMLRGIMGSNQASDVQFNRTAYEAFFDIIKETPGSLTVVSVFRSESLGFLTSLSEPEVWQRYKASVLDLAYQSKKACVRNELEEANQYQSKLNDQYVDLQRDKGRAEKDILNSQNRILRNDNDARVYRENLQTLEAQIENTGSGKALDKLIKKKEKIEKRLSKAEEEISSDQANIEKNQNDIERLLQDIADKELELKKQEDVIHAIQDRLDGVVP